MKEMTDNMVEFDGPSYMLGTQGLAVIMVLLQRAILEERDIVADLRGLLFEEEDGELFVLNPPEQLHAEGLLELVESLESRGDA